MLTVDTIPNNLYNLGKEPPTFSQAPETDSSTSAPKMVDLTFSNWLDGVQKEPDPFTALCKKCQKVAEDVWTTQFKDESGNLIDAKLCYWDWDSTAFGTKQPGTFRYIELFENSSKKPLVYIRLSQDKIDGEWLWINKGDKVSGTQSTTMAKKISDAIRLTYYLADSAKTPMNIGGEMPIRVPLQVMRGYGYYGPTFTLASTTSTKSKVRIHETNRTLFYKQNPKKHEKDLTWLQNLKISDILKNIVKDNQESVEWLTETKKFYFKKEGDVTLQKLILKLYQTKEARADYECAYLTLLCTTELPRDTPEQKKYYNVIKALHHNMLMYANFT